MKWLTFVVMAFIFCPGLQEGNGQESPPGYRMLRIPSGTPFPASEAELLRMRDKADKSAIKHIRIHAWDLLAGLTANGPVWNTWYTKCDVGLANCNGTPIERERDPRPLVRSLDVPFQLLQQLSLPLGSRGGLLEEQRLSAIAQRFLDQPQLASVLFNQEAKDHIINGCLYPRGGEVNGGKAKSCPPPPVAPGQVKPFERQSVILKTVWGILVIPKGQTTGELKIWRSDLWNKLDTGNEPSPDERKVKPIRVDGRLTEESGCADRDYKEDESIPISCFYYLKLEDADIRIMGKLPGFIRARGGSMLNEHDCNYLVLLGVHVTTKEIPEWVWATFWWDIHGKSDQYARQRPHSLGRRWDHFLMNTTLSSTTPYDARDGGPKICFNPYLETDLPYGSISNCLQCHRNAAYGPATQVNTTNLGILSRDGKRLASGGMPDKDYFKTRVQTDFIWSIANAQTPLDPLLLEQFNLKVQNLMLQQVR